MTQQVCLKVPLLCAMVFSMIVGREHDLNSLYHCADKDCTSAISEAEGMNDFPALTENKLGFRKQSRIQILGKPVDGGDHWIGKVGDRVGLVPVSLVREQRVFVKYPAFKEFYENVIHRNHNAKVNEAEHHLHAVNDVVQDTDHLLIPHFKYAHDQEKGKQAGFDRVIEVNQQPQEALYVEKTDDKDNQLKAFTGNLVTPAVMELRSPTSENKNILPSTFTSLEHNVAAKILPPVYSAETNKQNQPSIDETESETPRAPSFIEHPTNFKLSLPQTIIEDDSHSSDIGEEASSPIVNSDPPSPQMFNTVEALALDVPFTHAVTNEREKVATIPEEPTVETVMVMVKEEVKAQAEPENMNLHSPPQSVLVTSNSAYVDHETVSDNIEVNQVIPPQKSADSLDAVVHPSSAAAINDNDTHTEQTPVKETLSEWGQQTYKIHDHDTLDVGKTIKENLLEVIEPTSETSELPNLVLVHDSNEPLIKEKSVSNNLGKVQIPDVTKFQEFSSPEEATVPNSNFTLVTTAAVNQTVEDVNEQNKEDDGSTSATHQLIENKHEVHNEQQQKTQETTETFHQYQTLAPSTTDSHEEVVHAESAVQDVTSQESVDSSPPQITIDVVVPISVENDGRDKIDQPVENINTLDSQYQSLENLESDDGDSVKRADAEAGLVTAEKESLKMDPAELESLNTSDIVRMEEEEDDVNFHTSMETVLENAIPTDIEDKYPADEVNFDESSMKLIPSEKPLANVVLPPPFAEKQVNAEVKNVIEENLVLLNVENTPEESSISSEQHIATHSAEGEISETSSLVEEISTTPALYELNNNLSQVHPTDENSLDQSHFVTHQHPSIVNPLLEHAHLDSPGQCSSSQFEYDAEEPDKNETWEGYTFRNSFFSSVRHLAVILYAFLPENVKDTLTGNDALVLTGIIAVTLVSICVPYFFIERFFSVRPLKKRVTDLNKTLWKVSTAFENQQEEYDLFKKKALAYDEDKKQEEQLETELYLVKQIELKLKAENLNLRRRINKDVKVADELEGLITTTINERDEINVDREKLKLSLSSIQSKLTESLDELEKVREEEAGRRVDLELITHAKQTLELRGIALEKEIEELRLKLSSEIEVRRNLQSQTEDMTLEKMKNDEKLVEFKGILDKYEQRLDSLTEEVTLKESELLALKESLGEDSPLVEVAEITGKLRMAESQASALQARVESITLKNTSLARDCESTKAILEELRLEKDQAEVRLKVLESYFNEKEDELRRVVEKQEAEKQMRGKDKDELIELIEDRNDTVQDLTLKLEKLKQKLEETKFSHRNEIRTLEAKGHETWLSLCQSERKAQESRKESELLRQKLTAVTKVKEAEDAVNGEVLGLFADLDLEDVPLPLPNEALVPSYFGLGDFEPPIPLDDEEEEERDLYGHESHTGNSRPAPLGQRSPNYSDEEDADLSPIRGMGGRTEFSDGSSSSPHSFEDGQGSREYYLNGSLTQNQIHR